MDLRLGLASATYCITKLTLLSTVQGIDIFNMKLDYDYLGEILKLFNGVISLKPSEFFKALEGSNIEFEGINGCINEKFHRHLEHLVQTGVIASSDGVPALKNCGIYIGGNGHLSIADNTYIKATMKSVVSHENTSDNLKGKLDSMPKLFISHSSKDADIVEELIDMVEAIGLTSKEIFCTSIEGYGINLGENFLSRLKEELSSNTIVIFVLSNNFYESPVSLCEMGAAWAMSKEHVPILIPPLNYSDIEGVIPTSQGMKVNEPLKYNALKKKIESFFELEPIIDGSAWERKREKILKQIESALNKRYESNKDMSNFKGQYNEKEKIIFEEPFFYFSSFEGKEGPYCPRCWQKDEKKARVINTPDSYDGAQRCQVCDRDFGKGKPVSIPRPINFL